jgi:hypothetical protein
VITYDSLNTVYINIRSGQKIHGIINSLQFEIQDSIVVPWRAFGASSITKVKGLACGLLESHKDGLFSTALLMPSPPISASFNDGKINSLSVPHNYPLLLIKIIFRSSISVIILSKGSFPRITKVINQSLLTGHSLSLHHLRKEVELLIP